jgi:hypothetical protein
MNLEESASRLCDIATKLNEPGEWPVYAGINLVIRTDMIESILNFPYESDLQKRYKEAVKGGIPETFLSEAVSLIESVPETLCDWDIEQAVIWAATSYSSEYHGFAYKYGARIVEKFDVELSGSFENRLKTVIQAFDEHFISQNIEATLEIPWGANFKDRQIGGWRIGTADEKVLITLSAHKSHGAVQYALEYELVSLVSLLWLYHLVDIMATDHRSSRELSLKSPIFQYTSSITHTEILYRICKNHCEIHALPLIDAEKALDKVDSLFNSSTENINALKRATEWLFGDEGSEKEHQVVAQATALEIITCNKKIFNNTLVKSLFNRNPLIRKTIKRNLKRHVNGGLVQSAMQLYKLRSKVVHTGAKVDWSKAWRFKQDTKKILCAFADFALVDRQKA